MAIVNKVDLKHQVDIDVSIKYQIVTYCFFNNILISNSDLRFLNELAKSKDIEMTKFCNETVSKQIFKSSQSARNAITKAEKKNLIIKKRHNKKTISLNPDINVQASGVVLLDYKILGRESQES
jgi:hypothetical protein|tara:strand:+ start:698 stop:1069 length:372 start_codon:yes stop_codon:yes gene_type:complete